jgi:hypothetical protein
MQEEHEELHQELRRATKIRGKVGEAAVRVAEVLHPHFRRENELALPVIGVAKELVEGKSSPDFPKALDLADAFKIEYKKMLEERAEIVKALGELEKAAIRAKKQRVIEFTRKLRAHAKTEEDLTYPTVLMIGKMLRQ